MEIYLIFPYFSLFFAFYMRRVEVFRELSPLLFWLRLPLTTRLLDNVLLSYSLENLVSFFVNFHSVLFPVIDESPIDDYILGEHLTNIYHSIWMSSFLFMFRLCIGFNISSFDTNINYLSFIIIIF